MEIGRNHTAAKKLQEEHNQFTIASNVSINQILTRPGRNLNIITRSLHFIVAVTVSNVFAWYNV